MSVTARKLSEAAPIYSSSLVTQENFHCMQTYRTVAMPISTPKLEQTLLEPDVGLRSLLNAINQDLYLFKYISKSRSESIYAQNAVPVVTPKQESKRSVKYLLEKPDISPTEAAEGFLDDEGQEVFIINDVLEYCPRKGYLIEWLGFTEPSWNRASDMPKGCDWVKRAMESARRCYKLKRRM